MNESRLLTIIENEGYDCTRAERRRMAQEIIRLRAELAKPKWNGNASPAGHGENDSGINPVYTK